MARLPLDAVTGKVQRRALAERIALAERSSEPVEDLGAQRRGEV